MNILELFAGTCSIGKYCEQLGFNVVALDNDPKSNVTIRMDIMEWDYTEYPPGYFDIIWASPPCTEYSTMLVRRARRMEEADVLVQRVLEIIGYFEPRVWLIENPKTGFLKTREFMLGLPYVDVSYCKYGFDYRKHTRIWTNMVPTTKPMYCRGDCNKMRDGRHIGLVSKTRSLSQKHSIPQPLVKWIIDEAVESL